MADVVRAVVAGVALLAWTFVNYGGCPRGWYLEGVRPTGVSRCLPPLPLGCGEPRPPHDRPCPPDDRALPTLVHCTGGARPIVVDSQTLGCQR